MNEPKDNAGCFDASNCSSSFVLFLRWLKLRLKESHDTELRSDVLLRINANFREEMMQLKELESDKN